MGGGFSPYITGGYLHLTHPNRDAEDSTALEFKGKEIKDRDRSESKETLEEEKMVDGVPEDGLKRRGDKKTNEVKAMQPF